MLTSGRRVSHDAQVLSLSTDPATRPPGGLRGHRRSVRSRRPGPGRRGHPAASSRGVAGLALGAAFVWLAWRLRPRDGYGIRVDLAGAQLARAIDGRTERVLWPQILSVQQIGRWAPRWVLTLADGTRRELPRALFSDPAAFADLGRVLTRPAQSPRVDA